MRRILIVATLLETFSLYAYRLSTVLLIVRPLQASFFLLVVVLGVLERVKALSVNAELVLFELGVLRDIGIVA